MANTMIKILALALILTNAALFWQVYVSSSLHKELKEYEISNVNLQKQCDSLRADFFPISVELSRYETAYEIFARRNPKGASEYGDIISNETE